MSYYFLPKIYRKIWMDWGANMGGITFQVCGEWTFQNFPSWGESLPFVQHIENPAYKNKTKMAAGYVIESKVVYFGTLRGVREFHLILIFFNDISLKML